MRDERVERANEKEILDRLDPLAESEGATEGTVVSFQTDGHYPTSSPAVFKCQRVDMQFQEKEGEVPNPVNVDAGFIYVANITNIVPPQGALWIAHPFGNRWVMQYDGPSGS